MKRINSFTLKKLLKNFIKVMSFLCLSVFLMTQSASASSGTINAWDNCYVPIPDGPNGATAHSPGVTTSGAPSGSIITKVRVYYEVYHTWRSDLQIWLTTYHNGAWHDFMLRDREGGSTDNWIETRDNLTRWNGFPPNQTWYLVARDMAAGDVGYINFIQVWVDWATSGDISVDVRNSSGSRLNSSEMNAVLLHRQSNGSLVSPIEPPTSNPMTFSNISFGDYWVDVYCWDMWTKRLSFSHNSLNTSIAPQQDTRKRPLNLTVYYSGGDVVYNGATVHLESWKGPSGPWTQRASGITGSDGKVSFSAWPTTQSGEKYRLLVRNSVGSLVATRDNVTVANSSSGSSYDITTSQPVPTGTISVDVRDSSNVRLNANEMNAVILFDRRLPDGANEVQRREPPTANPVQFTGISYGPSYFVDVYCWDMLAVRSVPDFSHAASTTSRQLQANPKRPLKVTAYYAGGSVPFAGASVYLDSWNGQHSQWTQRASGTTLSDGSFTFNAWPTDTALGEKYRMRVHNGSETQVGSRDNVTRPNNTSSVNYDMTTSEEPPRFITAFTVPTGTQQRGQQVQTTVRVKNSSGSARRFWVGLSYAHQDATHDNWPSYHYDIKPQQTTILQPDDEQTLTFPCHLHQNLWPGQYFARARIWNDYNPDTHRMVGEPIDDTLFYEQWKDPTDPVNGTGMPSFSLGSYAFEADSLVGQIQQVILNDFYQVPNLYNLYANGKKLLLSIPVGTDSVTLGQKIIAEAGGSILIDLFDLFGVTPESQGAHGTVTIWVDAGASIGIGVGLPVNIITHEFDYNERATADYRKYLSGSVMSLTTPAFIATALECSGGSCKPRFQWGGNTQLGLDIVGVSAGQLVGGEVSRRLLLSYFDSVPGDVAGLSGLAQYIIDALSGATAPPFSTITYDDGSWPIYDGMWESPLKLSPPNSTDIFAHHFAINVPSGISRLRFVTDNVGQNRIGNANLYVQYGARPTLSTYRVRSVNSGNVESLSIDNPEAGEWFVMLPAETAYDHVKLAAILETEADPTVTIIATDPFAAEPGFDTGMVRLSRTGSTSGSLAVNIGKSGTATHGVDYVALPSTVTFGSGVAYVDLEIIPIDDDLVEGDETAIISVLPGTGYTVGSPSSATVTIADNDVADTQRPTATASVGNVTTAGGTTHSFTVTYSDNVAINVSTIDSSDIRVTGPNGFDQIATFVSVNNTANGTPRTATYRITAPGGSWGYGDNGAYSLLMRPNQVRDTSGNSVLEGMLTSFTVAIPGTGPSIEPIGDHDTPSPAGTAYTGPTPVVTGTPPITWSLITGPSGMTIDPATGIVSWSTPGPAGSSHLVTIQATNAEGVSQESWHLSVPQIPNQPPNRPDLISPANGATGVSLTPTLEAGPFSDPDPGDTHSGSRWMVFNEAGTEIVWDSGVGPAATSIQVPSGYLEPETLYYWSVWYYDSVDATYDAGPGPFSFTTGIPLEIETSSLPQGMEMVPYSAQLEATGGVLPYIWNVASGGFLESEQANSFAAVGTAWQSGMDQTYALSLPFEFPFYGDTYSTCYVDIHGTIYFAPRGTDFNPNETALANRAMIAALWRDYFPDVITISVENGVETTTVRWHRDDDVAYSASLHSDGRIVLKYGEGNANGGMIGVSAGNGVDYILSTKSESGSMNNADDIVFTPVGGLPEGLTVSPDGIISGTPTLVGTYPVTFVVTDGNNDTASAELDIVIEANPNTRPVIDSTTPPEGMVTMEESSSQAFSVTAHDPEGLPVTYHWTLNGETVGDGTASYTHSTDWGDAGFHVLRCYVSDDLWDQIVYAQWNITVPVPPPSTLTGRVRGAGVPLEGASVELRRVDGSVYRRVYTDASGNYVLDQVRSGYYRMKVGADFYADVWYQSANHLDQAEVLTVPADSVIGGLDFDLASGQSPALVEVTSDPAGADIYLDYWPTGEVTPAVINVGEVGDWDWAGYRLASHVITLKKAGHPRPSPQAVPAAEAETVAVDFDLTSSATGAVYVVTTPGGAEVYVDYADAAEGVTPIVVGNLAPGSHTILLRKSGYLQPRPIVAWVWEDETTEVAIPLEPDTRESKMMAEAHSVPQGIPIYIDYLPSGQVTDAVMGLMDPAKHVGSGWHSASHTILLRREGAPPMAPRYVPEIADTAHWMLIHLRVDPTGLDDSNGDGIPDWMWEQHGYNPHNPPAVNAIADASGMTYGDKLRAGLIPGDPNSRFEMGGVEIAGDPETGLTITFVFDTVPGRRYVVQARESLTAGGWTNISSVITAMGYQTVFSAQMPVDMGNQFYRLIVLAP